jgi:hypothetical protein
VRVGFFTGSSSRRLLYRQQFAQASSDRQQRRLVQFAQALYRQQFAQASKEFIGERFSTSKLEY